MFFVVYWPEPWAMRTALTIEVHPFLLVYVVTLIGVQRSEERLMVNDLEIIPKEQVLHSLVFLCVDETTDLLAGKGATVIGVHCLERNNCFHLVGVFRVLVEGLRHP